MTAQKNPTTTAPAGYAAYRDYFDSFLPQIVGQLLLPDLRALSALGKRQRFFEPIEYRIWVSSSGDPEAVVRMQIGDKEEHSASLGDGPVHALDLALRKALLPHYPAIETFHLIDYKVRILDGENATAARTRVHIETSNGERPEAHVTSSRARCYAVSSNSSRPMSQRRISDVPAPIS